jgi:hypothetical protein
MKRLLNPELVRDNKTCGANWVFLRDFREIPPFREVGIGSIEVEVVPESPAEIEFFKAGLQDTEAALSKLSGMPPNYMPHVILTQDCFDISGPVRILIYSRKPFASNASA